MKDTKRFTVQRRIV